jgi:acid phosphatase (class A)
MKFHIASILLLSCASVALAQAPAPASNDGARAPYFLDTKVVDATVLLPGPPAADSTTAKDELKELHAIEVARTPAQVEAAKADDKEEDIFIYRTVFGAGFTAEALPAVA